jgi:hypothetical protein
MIEARLARGYPLMRRHPLSIGLIVVVVVTSVCFAGRPAYGQTNVQAGVQAGGQANIQTRVPSGGQAMDAREPIMGTWKLDPARSSLKRGGPSATARPIRPATWVFAAEGDGFRMSEYDGDSTASTPTLSYFAKFDSKEYPHPGGREKGETVAHWHVSPYLLVRLARVNDKPTEWVIYAISSDGKVLTTTSWDPETPEYHNVRVFDRKSDGGSDRTSDRAGDPESDSGKRPAK